MKQTSKTTSADQHSYEDLKKEAINSFHQQKLEDAFFITCAALKRPQADREMRLLFAQTHPERYINAFNPLIKDALYQTLTEEGIDYQRLMSAWYAILTHDPFFAPLFALYDRAELSPNDWHELETRLIDPYFVEGIRRFNVGKITLENILTALRRKIILEFWPKGYLKTKHLAFISAMAEQCYSNEYIFECSEEERKALETLPKDDPIAVSILACYQSLDELDVDAKLSANAGFRKLVKLQILDPREREELAKSIGCVGYIDNDVSQKVRSMYEENPYPRWRFLNIPVSADTNFKPEVLVAGCGTGWFMTTLAALFPNAHITGIDITRASLAYAMQKAEQYSFKNLKYFQCDILKVKELGQSFDFINCSGVLHHMEDPKAGWKNLLSVLKPGGSMYISLYSTIARRTQSKIREFVSENGYTPTPEGIRRFRKDALKKFSQNADVFSWHDFYSTSEVRDLFFHVQEKSYTIPELQVILDELDLEFVRFIHVNETARREYKRLAPDDTKMNNLKIWETMENNIPDTFANMYNIKCKRKNESLSYEGQRFMNMGV